MHRELGCLALLEVLVTGMSSRNSNLESLVLKKKFLWRLKVEREFC